MSGPLVFLLAVLVVIPVVILIGRLDRWLDEREWDEARAHERQRTALRGNHE